jgi:hypothetical protein
LAVPNRLALKLSLLKNGTNGQARKYENVGIYNLLVFKFISAYYTYKYITESASQR